MCFPYVNQDVLFFFGAIENQPNSNVSKAVVHHTIAHNYHVRCRCLVVRQNHIRNIYNIYTSVHTIYRVHIIHDDHHVIICRAFAVSRMLIIYDCRQKGARRNGANVGKKTPVRL